MAKKRLTRESVEAAIQQSSSVMQAMRVMGYRSLAGGSHAHLAKKIKEWGISTAHHLGKRSNSGKRHVGGCKKKTAKEILIYHTDGKRQRAEQILRGLAEIGRKFSCSGCGINQWREKPLVLEVEHKDGDFQNDLPENLDLICPNCHSQTPTYCRIKSRVVLGT